MKAEHMKAENIHKVGQLYNWALKNGFYAIRGSLMDKATTRFVGHYKTVQEAVKMIQELKPKMKAEKTTSHSPQPLLSFQL